MPPIIHRNALLLECADELTLEEVLASLPARALIWRISPTVAALDPEMEEEALGRLKRDGISARVVES
jgi:hypothetical protein